MEWQSSNGNYRIALGGIPEVLVCIGDGTWIVLERAGGDGGYASTSTSVQRTNVLELAFEELMQMNADLLRLLKTKGEEPAHRYMADNTGLSNKACRRVYGRITVDIEELGSETPTKLSLPVPPGRAGSCTCPEDRCWYLEQKDRREAGKPAICWEAWAADVEADEVTS